MEFSQFLRASSVAVQGYEGMTLLKIKDKQQCQWDLVSLGEVMLRLDPGDSRIATTRQFRAWEGGGEYNVARGLKRCFRMDTAIVTVLAATPVGSYTHALHHARGVHQRPAAPEVQH